MECHSCVSKVSVSLTLEQSLRWLDQPDWFLRACTRVHDRLRPGAHVAIRCTVTNYDFVALALRLSGFEVRDCLRYLHRDGWSPILVARKPPEGTLAENAIKHGTCAFNVGASFVTADRKKWEQRPRVDVPMQPEGRYPPNLMHDGSEDVVAGFPLSKGQQGDVRGTEKSRTGGENTHCYGEFGRVPAARRGDDGSASRFYHTLPTKFDLVAYLCRLVTPERGVVLDPSGSALTRRVCDTLGFGYAK